MPGPIVATLLGPYLPAALHDEFDAWAKTYASPFDDLIVATANRNWDHELRIAEMDADGVAAEVLLPNTVFPLFFPTTLNITISLPCTRDELDKRWAGVQAHNRWQIDFCSLALACRRVGSNLPQRCRAGPRRDSLGVRVS